MSISGPTHHERQGGEKKARDELDIGAVTHDQPEALKEGHRLGLLGLIGLWGSERIMRRE